MFRDTDDDEDAPAAGRRGRVRVGERRRRRPQPRLRPRRRVRADSPPRRGAAGGRRQPRRAAAQARGAASAYAPEARPPRPRAGACCDFQMSIWQARQMVRQGQADIFHADRYVYNVRGDFCNYVERRREAPRAASWTPTLPCAATACARASECARASTLRASSRTMPSAVSPRMPAGPGAGRPSPWSSEVQQAHLGPARITPSRGGNNGTCARAFGSARFHRCHLRAANWQEVPQPPLKRARRIPPARSARGALVPPARRLRAAETEAQGRQQATQRRARGSGGRRAERAASSAAPTRCGRRPNRGWATGTDGGLPDWMQPPPEGGRGRARAAAAAGDAAPGVGGLLGARHRPGRPQPLRRARRRRAA